MTPQEAVALARSLRKRREYDAAIAIYDQLTTDHPPVAIPVLAELSDCFREMPQNRYSLYVGRYFDFGIRPDDRVLDIGSGHDPFPLATHLADRSLKNNNLGRGGSQFKALRDRPVFECDVEDMRCFEDRSFDFVHCSHVLEHAYDPARACRELMRVGRRGYIETPTRGKDAFLDTAKISNHRWAVEHVHGVLSFVEYTEQDIEGLGCDVLMQMHCAPQTVREKAFAALVLLRAHLVNTMVCWDDSFDWEVRWRDGRIERSSDVQVALPAVVRAPTEEAPPKAEAPSPMSDVLGALRDRVREPGGSVEGPSMGLMLRLQKAARAERPALHEPVEVLSTVGGHAKPGVDTAANPNTSAFYDVLYGGKYVMGSTNLDWDYEAGDRMDWYRRVAALEFFASSGHYLDVGCGLGGLFAVLPPVPTGEEPRVLFGIDFSEVAIRKARERLTGHFTVGRAEALPYPDGYFDRISCTETLEHVDDPDAVLRSMAAKLVPGGKLLITVPEELLDLDDHEWPGGVSLHINRFSIASLVKAVSAAGLRVESAILDEREIWMIAAKMPPTDD